MVLNKQPIFIVGFERGGSNLVLNLLRSHPDVCSPRGELQEVFIGKNDDSYLTRLAKLVRYLPIVLKERQHVFSDTLWQERKALSHYSKRRLDEILFNEKLLARAPSQNKYKSENELYSDIEIKASRLLVKNLNGLVFMSKQFADLYPDAHFIAIVRNGLAVCEGHIRRGYKAQEIANHYEKACQALIQDAHTLDNFHLFRYEDLVNKPLETSEQIFNAANLKRDKLKKIRMETSKVMNEQGEHSFTSEINQKQLIWYDLAEFAFHFKKDANANQIRRLSEQDKKIILKTCHNSLHYFGYLEDKHDTTAWRTCHFT